MIVLASCAAPCTLTASATVSLAGASRSLKLRGIVRQAASGKQVRLRLALSKKTLRSIRRALRRGVKLTAKVTVVATDAAGELQQVHAEDQAAPLMGEETITEQELAAYEPVTTSGAALKERLEAATSSADGPAGDRRVLR